MTTSNKYSFVIYSHFVFSTDPRFVVWSNILLLKIGICYKLPRLLLIGLTKKWTPYYDIPSFVDLFLLFTKKEQYAKIDVVKNLCMEN